MKRVVETSLVVVHSDDGEEEEEDERRCMQLPLLSERLRIRTTPHDPRQTTTTTTTKGGFFNARIYGLHFLVLLLLG